MTYYQIRIDTNTGPADLVVLAAHENRRRACEVAASFWIAEYVTAAHATDDAHGFAQDALPVAIANMSNGDTTVARIETERLAVLRDWMEDRLALMGMIGHPCSDALHIAVVEIDGDIP